MKEQIIKKGYRVNPSKISEPYFYEDAVGSFETRGKAKVSLAAQFQDEMRLYNGVQVYWFNIPLIRDKNYDTIIFEGEEIIRHKAQYLINKNEFNSKLDKMISDDSIKFCYIRKRGCYYGDNYNGYTEFKLKAGIYPKEDAIKHARGCLELTIVPINIEEHNKYIQGHILDLQNRLIKL